MGQVITFYSYKGGVGRSMAMANVAVLLATRGLRVLAVDWDLEAPGLERYFTYFETDTVGNGLINLLLDQHAKDPTEYVWSVNVQLDTNHAVVDFLPSGRGIDDHYTAKLERLNWDRYFAIGGGDYLESLRDGWKSVYDVTLIDSRTGLSDSGGVCTIQMPDIVVAMFTATHQSLYGVRDIMRLAQKARHRLEYDRTHLAVVPLPARFASRTEFAESQEWLDRFAKELGEFYLDWLPSWLAPRQVVELLKVPQVDYFSFGERLAVVEQGTSDPESMGFTFDRLANLLANDLQSAEVALGITEVPQRVAPGPSDTRRSADETDYAYDVYVSYAHDAVLTDFLRLFVEELSEWLSFELGRDAHVFFDQRELSLGDTWSDILEDSLVRSKLIMPILTPGYYQSPWSLSEWDRFETRELKTGIIPLVMPIMLNRSESVPARFATRQFFDMSGLPVHIAAFTDKRQSMRITERIHELAKSTARLLATVPPFDRRWLQSFFDSPLGERLLTSLDGGKPDDISAAVAAIGERVWAGALEPAQVEEVLEKLQGHRQVQHVIEIADAATTVGTITTSSRRRYCQMLIESRALHAAELACAELLDLAEDAKERGEALGLLGRIRKERYVTSRRDDDLRGAIAAYQFAYEGGSDPLWHGVNLLALTSRADRDGIEVPGEVDTDALPLKILDEIRKTEPEMRDIWERTTEIEALVALGDKTSVDEAVSAAQQLAGSRGVRPFELESLRRQLTDIWELEPHHPVLVAIADQKLLLGAKAHVELPDSPGQLEKIFGTVLPVGYKHLLMGLHCAESVGKITDASGEPWGTGFLLQGSLIHPDFGDGPVLVTNAHVCSPEPGVGKLLPSEATAMFDVTKSVDGEQLVLTGFECLWSSPPSVCDVTVLGFTGPQPALEHALSVAESPQPVTEGAYVYVIGHPAGGGIKFSIRGNDLLAYDADMFKVHYTAPTEGGSSGSPVFNQAWQLMAVHHAGDSKMRRLDDPSATYQANEGITIKAIQEECGRRRPTGS